MVHIMYDVGVQFATFWRTKIQKFSKLIFAHVYRSVLLIGDNVYTRSRLDCTVKHVHDATTTCVNVVPN